MFKPLALQAVSERKISAYPSCAVTLAVFGGGGGPNAVRSVHWE